MHSWRVIQSCVYVSFDRSVFFYIIDSYCVKVLRVKYEFFNDIMN